MNTGLIELKGFLFKQNYPLLLTENSIQRTKEITIEQLNTA